MNNLVHRYSYCRAKFQDIFTFITNTQNKKFGFGVSCVFSNLN